VFSADVTAERVIGECAGGFDGNPDMCGPGGWRTRHPHPLTERVRGRRWFVSGFDDAERVPLYFLAELPGRAYTYAAALRMFRPAAVRAADRRCLEVVRQGDMFAIPSPFTTRHLQRRGATIVRGLAGTYRGGFSRNDGALIDGTSHVGTEVAVLPNGTAYARGMLYHRPGGWRRPEHRRVRLGDGRTWYHVVRNTVPLDDAGNPRAWTIAGSVD
jgi:hypothetical protein